MNALIDNLQEVTSDRGQLYSAFASLKFENIDLKNYKNVTDEEKSTLKK